jgi:D-2-hydroxyacid dehydrogenase (NADP+)
MAQLPPLGEVTILFAHAAYRLKDALEKRRTDLKSIEVRSREDLDRMIGQADVALTSGLWRNDLLPMAPKLKFVQSISAGTDQYSKEAFAAKGVRLASAHGVNERAVAEHAMASILALARMLHTGRDNQHRKLWRGMISDPRAREDEMGDKTLLIVGLGRIGSRLARLAKAFDMRVIATKRDPAKGGEAADAVHPDARLLDLIPQADIVCLTCPLTPETENLIGARALAAMKPGAHLVNVARGRVVDEDALIATLKAGKLAAAALDCTRVEPLPADSPLWGFENVLITPHTAGETSKYEDNVVDILLDNMERLWRGETQLRNQVV